MKGCFSVAVIFVILGAVFAAGDVTMTIGLVLVAISFVVIAFIGSNRKGAQNSKVVDLSNIPSRSVHSGFENTRHPSDYNRSDSSSMNAGETETVPSNTYASSVYPDEQTFRQIYFEECLELGDEIIGYIRKVMDDEEMFETIMNIRGIECLDTDIFGKYNTRIVMIVFHDLWKCYLQVGNRVDDKGYANLCYAIAFSKLTNNVNMDNLCIHNLRRSMQNLGKSTMEMIERFGFQDHDGPMDFLMYEVYNNLGRDTGEYDRLLYKVSECMARHNRTISKKAKSYLNSFENKEDSGIIEEDSADKDNIKERNYKCGEELLNELVGLDEVKEDVRKLRDFVIVQNKRKEMGLPSISVNYHCVFTGNPGTGKTTVARIIADIYSSLGILKKGHLVETDRSGLIAEYVGQTAVKTNKIIDRALDGVLFIDEAYTLFSEASEDYGMEAIATLLKRMEDDRDRLVVILAGYGEEMRRMINSNPGLQSRFNRYFHFRDYTASELYVIFMKNVKKYQYLLEPEADEKIKGRFEKIVSQKGENFGNARYVRNIFEKILENHAVRISASDLTDKHTLQCIKAVDIP